MKPGYEDIVEMTALLMEGYTANGRATTTNDRLTFILLLVILTKRSIPHVLGIRRNQFKPVRSKCIFRDVSPRAQNVYRIEFPLAFYEYLEKYCAKYIVESSSLLFNLNSEYVGNRFRELLKILQKPFSISDIQMMIPHLYNTSKYNVQMEKYMLLLPISEETHYFSKTGVEMAKKIGDYIKLFSDDTKLI